MKHASQLKGGIPPVEYREHVTDGQIVIVAIAGPSTVGRLVARRECGSVWLLGDVETYEHAHYLRRSWISRMFKDRSRLFDPVSFRGLGIGSELMKWLQGWCLKNQVVEVYGSIVEKDLLATPHLLDWYRRRGFDVREPHLRCLRGATYQVIWRPRAETMD